MSEPKVLSYCLKNQLELNLAYMPFIIEGGLFIPTSQTFNLGEKIIVALQLPTTLEAEPIEGKVIWITPKNALYQIFPGVGIQFTGEDAKGVREQIKAHLDNKLDVGGYTYGIAGQKK